MFKLYAKMTELSERDMSAATLKRMRWYAVSSLLYIPITGMWKLELLPSAVNSAVWGVLVILLTIPLLILLSSRLVNRVWVRDKYLDEWELRIKHRTMALAFQVVLYAISTLLALGIILDFANFTLPTMTPLLLGYVLFSLMVLGLYVQIFAQLAMVQPIEDDEFEESGASRRPLKGVVIASIAAFSLFILVPFTFGVVAGYKNAHSVALLGDQAKAECEGRGSKVSWVSSKNGGDFACFDENRPAPADLDPSPETP